MGTGAGHAGPTSVRSHHLNDLGLAVPDDFSEALAPFDGFVQSGCLKHPPATGKLLQLEERPIAPREYAVREAQAGVLGLEGAGCDQHPGLNRLVDKLAHLLHKFWAGGNSRLWTMGVIMRIVS